MPEDGRVALKDLRTRAREVSTRALERGALQPIATRATTIRDDGIDFAVRILENIGRKDRAAEPNAPGNPRRNPFLPYDPELFVADVGPDHVALLNKFNVVDEHLLIVTRHFEPQEAWLTPENFAALLGCLDVFEGLGFYNSGPEAGASQPHRHLQLIPLPLGPDGPPFPLAPRWERCVPTDSGVLTAPLPFPHALTRIRELTSSDDKSLSLRASHLWAEYRRLLGALGVGGERDERPRPYNLLMTREWLFAVGRRAECFEGISLNAMAFAGALLVRNQQQLETLTHHGPFAALGAVAG